jgi:hypothetical protein
MHVEHGYLTIDNSSASISKTNQYINNKQISEGNVKIIKNILAQNVQPIPMSMSINNNINMPYSPTQNV